MRNNGMVDNSEIIELSEIYEELDTNGRKKTTLMAILLLDAQMIGENQDKYFIDNNKIECKGEKK